MKIFNKVLIILLPIFTISFAQIDTTCLAFYPIKIGNYWEYSYEIDDWLFPPGSYYLYYSYEVIGDSSFPNGKAYKIIKKTKLDSTQLISYLFERIDSTTCNVYRYITSDTMEYLIDSLRSQVGDSSKATRTFPIDDHKTICSNIRTDTILNNITVSKDFIEQHWHSPIYYKLSKGFGLTYINYYFDFGTFTQHLLYARIDSFEYGTQVNSVPNESNPIINDFKLYQNFPNPFNSTTTVPFELPQESQIEIAIFDITGKKIKSISSGYFSFGGHEIVWDGTNQSGNKVCSGIYIYRLTVSSVNNQHNTIKSAKLVLLK